METTDDTRKAKQLILWGNAAVYVLCMVLFANGVEAFIGSVFVQVALNFVVGLILVFMPTSLQKEMGKSMLLSSLLLLVIGVPVCFMIGLSKPMNFH